MLWYAWKSVAGSQRGSKTYDRLPNLIVDKTKRYVATHNSESDRRGAVSWHRCDPLGLKYPFTKRFLQVQQVQKPCHVFL